MIVAKLYKYLLFTILTCSLPTIILANKSEKDTPSKEFNINEIIMHHVKDAHEWHLWGSEHDGVSIHLPVILYDKGFKVFNSSHFYHGAEKMVKDTISGEEFHYLVGAGPAKGYALFHEKIYTVENETIHFKEGHPHNPKPLDLSITKNVVSRDFQSLFFFMTRTHLGQRGA